jgi:hypothetical protein
MGLPYEFKQISADELEVAKTEWMHYVEEHIEDVSLSFYEGCFASCGLHVDGNGAGDGRTAIYGVVPHDGGTPYALVSLAYARPQSPDAWLKVLSIYVEPSLNVAVEEPDISKLAWIAATAIVGSIGLTYNEMPAKELKVWANVPMTKEFLTAVSTATRLTDNFDISSHGNWLVIRKR